MFIPALLLVSLAAPAAPAIQSAPSAPSAPSALSSLSAPSAPSAPSFSSALSLPAPQSAQSDSPRVWLGVSVQTVGEGARDGSERQLEIKSVVDGAPAAQAGLHEGDRLTAVDGEHVASHDQLVDRLRSLDPGAEVKITLRRKLEAELEAQGPDDKRARLGVSLGDVNDPSNLRDARIQIQSVVKGSPADKAGVKSGDALISIDGETFDSTDEVVERIGEHSSGDHVQIWVERTVRVRVAERPGSARIERDEPHVTPPEGHAAPEPPSRPHAVVPPRATPRTPPRFVPRATPRPTPRGGSGGAVTADDLRQLTEELRELRKEIAQLRDQVSKLEQRR